MSEKKTDLRIQKTYKALCESFTELMENKRFDDLTVNELCENAMVRRATFYKHFADKYDFFGFYIREIRDQFTEQISPFETDSVYSYHIYLFEKCLGFFEKHKRLIGNVLKSNMFPTLLDIFSDEIYQGTLLYLKEHAKKDAAYPVSFEILSAFLTGGTTQVLRYWLTSQTPPSTEELKASVRSLYQDVMFSKL